MCISGTGDGRVAALIYSVSNLKYWHYFSMIMTIKLINT